MIDHLLHAERWARVGLIFGAGVLAALALAPFFWWQLLPLSLGYLLHHLMRCESPPKAFRLGWWWGFGFFLAGLYWIVISMTVDLPRFGWMIPFALLGMNGGLALFPALAGCLFKWLSRYVRQNKVMQWLLFSLLLFVAEWLRGHILTGFPWNLVGYVWGASDSAIQMASQLSIYPLTLLTIVMGSSFALWSQRWPPVLSVLLLLAALAFGQWRLQSAEPFTPEQPMLLVQANIKQRLKNDQYQARASFQTHVDWSRASKAKVIIWPESALPFAINPSEPIPKAPFAWLGDDQILITGAVVVEQGANYYNSIIALDHQAQVLARYDKQHLVPFGEYVPFRELLPIAKITPGLADFRPGLRKRQLLLREIPFHPLICYEVIFPEYSTGQPQRVLLNLTNDDWFGYSSGPFQHLTMARFRAAEQNMPLIRVANSGISAVIDAYGRVQKSLPLHESGAIKLN